MKTKLVINHITNWLNNYSESTKTKGFVIGISGGVDSAVTSVLAAKTGLPITCIEMPIHQKKPEIERAKRHIACLKENYLNVTSLTLDLTDVYEKFISTLIINEEENQLALANSRARLRMVTLYYFAQSKNSLVLGTGNKIEDFGIGFFTKYGDGGVDISPIADLLKSEVYKLAKELNINNDILIAAPTDGLWEEERTDESQIGATYPELEWAMQFKEEQEPLSRRQEDVLRIYKRLHKMNQHKMNKIPVCIIPENLK